MKKTYIEEWKFEITVKKGVAERCRMGLETGDKFVCKYECPTGFCPKTMPVLHTYCEVIRCGGNFELSGSTSSYEIDFPCTDGEIVFHLVAKHLDS